MNLPSTKTLKTIAGDRAKELRNVLELKERSDLESLLETGKYPVTAQWYRSCFNPMDFQTAKLSIASEIIPMGHGVEYIPGGRGSKSPAIEYVNTGDTYRTTLMYVSGRGYKVGCWGNIVERGNYA